MQIHSTRLTSLLGAILISSGLASSLAHAKDNAEQSSPIVTTEAEQDQASDLASETDMVEVRISMPDGRVIIRQEPAARRASKRISSRSIEGSSSYTSSARVSSARGAVSGGGNSTSVSTGGSSSGSSGGISSGARSSGGGSAGSSNTASQTPSTKSSGGIYSQTNPAGGSGTSIVNPSGSSAHSGSSKVDSPRSVPTIGSPSYRDDGATGGQRVEFHDAGMGAAVIGNTIYFTGVEFVQVNQGFGVVTGTRLGSDSVRMEDMRLASSSSNPLSSWNVGASTIKLDFESDTVVDLVMHSICADANNPSREQRTWTVRIR